MPLHTQIIVDTLQAPTHLTQHPISGNLYITDQPGRIYRLSKDGNQVELWLDLTDRIIPLQGQHDESGLLSITFSKDGKELFLFSSRHPNLVPGEIEIFYPREVTQDEDLVEEYAGDLHVDVLTSFPVPNEEPHLDEEKYYFTILRYIRIHHGGKIAFGPEDKLYITVGDAGPQTDTYNHAQDLGQVFGKILRISPNFGSDLAQSNIGTYDIPVDNPFINMTDVIPEIYAYGFRNPWSLTLSSNGQFYIADVGYEEMEEVDILIKGGNYGWNIKEGTLLTSWSTGGERKELEMTNNVIDPIYEYPHRGSSYFVPNEAPFERKSSTTAIIGGYYITEGNKLPKGYYFADLIGPIMRINKSNGRWQLDGKWDLPDKDQYKIYGWGKDKAGFLYLLVINTLAPKGEQGEVIKILSIS